MALFGKKKTASETADNASGAVTINGNVISRGEEAVAHYASLRKAARRRRGLRIFAVVLAVALFGGASFAAAFISNLNTELTSGVDQELRSALTAYDAGQPFYMLLLGVDRDEGRTHSAEYGAEDSAYRSDTIILARVDPQTPQVTLVSIHRDTSHIFEDGSRQKINAAYTIGGPAYVVKVISEFAGVPISHYAQIDIDQLVNIVDTVGGVEIDLPVDVVDTQYTGIDLKAGTQTLDGHTAMLLCRARHAYDAYGDGDLYRAANQRAVIAAIAKKVLASDPATMAATVSAMAKSVTTDMDIQSILSLANQMRGLDVEHNIYHGMNPTISEYVNDTWFENNDDVAWAAMMERVKQGLPPYSETDQDMTEGVAAKEGKNQTPAGSEPNPDKSEEEKNPNLDYSGTVIVYNGAGIAGLATERVEKLNNAGFTASPDTAVNYYDTSVIVYNGDNRSKADAVAEALGGNISVIANDGNYEPSVDVVVVLGADQG